MTLIYYCIFCYLYEIGFSLELNFDTLRFIFAPMIFPIDLGILMFKFLKK